VIGFFKFTDLQAAVALPQLGGSSNACRRATTRQLPAERLANQPGLKLPPFEEPARSAMDRRADRNRAAVSTALDEAKIGNAPSGFRCAGRSLMPRLQALQQPTSHARTVLASRLDLTEAEMERVRRP
jgi:hypothetical protein